jgi:hypothetical protein
MLHLRPVVPQTPRCRHLLPQLPDEIRSAAANNHETGKRAVMNEVAA